MLIHNRDDIPYQDLESRLDEIASQQHTPRWHPTMDDLGQAAPPRSRWHRIRARLLQTPVIGRLARSLWPHCRPARLKQLTIAALRRIPPAYRLAGWGYRLISGPGRQRELQEQFLELNHRVYLLNEQLQALDQKQREDHATLDARLREHAHRLQKSRHDIQRLEDTLRLLPATPAAGDPAPPPAAGHPPHTPFVAGALDRFYTAFEDRFRGEEEAITRRLQTAYGEYIDLLAPSSRAIDLGCGRGEWLALLTARGIDATGVDLTASMVERCRRKGLKVELTDAAAHLAARQPDSTHLITAFHLAEHLPFPRLLELIVLARRALCEGGLLIMETPNPENLQVGAHTFYMDPTHRHPLPPALLAFAAHSQGFERTHIQRLHPCQPFDAATSSPTDKLLYGPQDYAMIAWK